MQHITLFILVVFGSMLISACQSTPVLPVAQPNPPVLAVQQDPKHFHEQLVTWGGVILQTNNKEEGSEVIILSKRLTNSTRPVDSDQSLGRFIAKVDGFIDPAVYANSRELTIYGTVIATETRKVDNYDYVYPVVKVIKQHLWPVRIYYDDRDDYWYGPWYYPYPYYHHSHPRTINSIKTNK